MLPLNLFMIFLLKTRIYVSIKRIIFFNIFHDHLLLFTGLDTFVNNCGVMVFGESEWLTDNLIDYQINVNLAGTIKLTKRFLPLIRISKARVVNVTSHCALRALPGLSVYGG